MLDQQIEAVFENGVFCPLGPVQLPEHQRVMLVLPAGGEALEEDIVHQPLAFNECKTIRLRFKRIRDFGPLPYPVESDESEKE